VMSFSLCCSSLIALSGSMLGKKIQEKKGGVP